MPAPPVYRTITEMRQQVSAWKATGLRIGLVPTMGALHDGHLSLVNQIAAQVDCVIVSIFINPTQFAAHEDLDTYPRHEAADLEKLAAYPAHSVFIPSGAEIYPTDFATSISLQGPARGLESDERPHFFSGVALIVAKLLIQSQTDYAIFGEKDYQQLLVIKRMVRDLDLPVEVLTGPIQRAADGLALSSRNAHLNPEQRRIAGQLNQILKTLAQATRNPREAEAEAHDALLQAGFTRVDYACIRDGDTLQPITPTTRSRRALIAARLGDIRLIDNMPAG